MNATAVPLEPSGVCVCARAIQCVSSGTVKARLSNLEKWKSDILLIHTRTHAKRSARAFVNWWIAARAAVTRHN